MKRRFHQKPKAWLRLCLFLFHITGVNIKANERRNNYGKIQHYLQLRSRRNGPTFWKIRRTRTQNQILRGIRSLHGVLLKAEAGGERKTWLSDRRICSGYTLGERRNPGLPVLRRGYPSI